MARAWFTSWVAFSASVIFCTRSAARCSADRLVSRYAGLGAFCAPAIQAAAAHVSAAAIIFNPKHFIGFLFQG